MTLADFRIAFPEFASKSDPTVQAALDASPPYFDVDRWDDLLSDGVGNWVAHRLAMKDLVASIGAFGATASSASTEKRVGEVSIKTSVSRSQTTRQRGAPYPYSLTVYGVTYWHLMQQVGIGAVAV